MVAVAVKRGKKESATPAHRFRSRVLFVSLNMPFLELGLTFKSIG